MWGNISSRLLHRPPAIVGYWIWSFTGKHPGLGSLLPLSPFLTNYLIWIKPHLRTKWRFYFLAWLSITTGETSFISRVQNIAIAELKIQEMPKKNNIKQITDFSHWEWGGGMEAKFLSQELGSIHIWFQPPSKVRDSKRITDFFTIEYVKIKGEEEVESNFLGTNNQILCHG